MSSVVLVNALAPPILYVCLIFVARRYSLYLFVSANFVAVAGALLAPLLCDGMGRRKTFSVSCMIFIAGVSFVVLAPSLVADNKDAYGVMMVGRVLTVSLMHCCYFGTQLQYRSKTLKFSVSFIHTGRSDIGADTYVVILSRCSHFNMDTYIDRDLELEWAWRLTLCTLQKSLLLSLGSKHITFSLP